MLRVGRFSTTNLLPDFGINKLFLALMNFTASSLSKLLLNCASKLVDTASITVLSPEEFFSANSTSKVETFTCSLPCLLTRLLSIPLSASLMVMVLAPAVFVCIKNASPLSMLFRIAPAARPFNV